MARSLKEFPQDNRVVRLPPNQFGLTFIGFDYSRFVPIEVIVVGTDPGSGEEVSFSFVLESSASDVKW